MAAVTLILLLALAPRQDGVTENVWLPESADSDGFCHGGFVGDGTFLYRFGGRIAANVLATDIARRYDPATDTWTTLAPMPWENDPLQGVNNGVATNCGAYLDGAVYSFGSDRGGYTGTGAIYRYDIADNEWTLYTAVSFATSRQSAAAVVVNGLIYITGGQIYQGGGEQPLSNLCTEFDPVNVTLTERAAVPTGIAFHAAAERNGRMYLFGGAFDGSMFVGRDSVFEFTPATNIWRTLDPMAVGGTSYPRLGLRAAALGRRIYVSGGTTDGGMDNVEAIRSTLLEFLPPSSPTGQGAWTLRRDMLQPRNHHGLGMAGGRLYAFGNSLAGAPENTMEEYTPPSFGSAPDAPAGVAQSDSTGPLAPKAVTTDSQITFSATLSDPDATEQLTWDVEVKRAADPWSAATLLTTGPVAQGAGSITYTVPSVGDYDWRHRVTDPELHATPATGWTDFDGGSPDFTVSSVAPPPPPPPPPPPGGAPPASGGGGGGGGCSSGPATGTLLPVLFALALLSLSRLRSR